MEAGGAARSQLWKLRMNEIIGTLNNAFTLAFVVTSMFGLGLGLTLRDLLAPLRSGRLDLLGGPSPAVRRTLAVTSSQRNFAAAFVIAQGSFAAQPDVFLMVLAASLVSMAVTVIAAGEFGRRTGRVATP